VIARLLQAAGAAALTPTSLALLLNAVSIERRPWALGIWTAVGAMAAAAGPTAGGILVTLSWRWVFLVNVPVGVITIALATSLLSEHRGEKSAAGPDLLGSLLLTLAIGSLALGIVEGPDWGWSSGRVAGALITSVILVGWFVRRTLRHPSPIIEPAMVRVRSFAVASIAALFFNAAFSIMLLGLVQYMTDLWGYSAMRTGLAISPGPIMVRMIAPRAQSLVQRWGSTAVATLGTGLLFAGAMVWYLRTGTERAYVTDLLPGLILGGTGFGLTLPVLLTTAARSLPPQRFATGSAVITMARQIGTVLGVSLLVVLLDSGTHGSIVAIHRGWLAMAGAALAAAGFSLFLTGRTRPSVALATNR
jgi:hypothetical protein